MFDAAGYYALPSPRTVSLLDRGIYLERSKVGWFFVSRRC